MNNRIIVEYSNVKKYPNIKILNEKNEECLICMCKLKENKIMLTNYYCKCFNSVLLCELCFLKWFKMNNRCFVCRNLFYNPQIQNKLINYKIDNIILKNKLKKKNFGSRIININNIENQQNEIVSDEENNSENEEDISNVTSRNNNINPQTSIITPENFFLVLFSALIPTFVILIINAV